MINISRTCKIMLLFVLAVLPVSAYVGPETFSLAPLISDNMVLQRERDVPLWGRGTPGTQVTIRASWGASGESLVRPDGTWMIRLRTPAAGGPYTLHIAHDDTSTLVANVLSGEVWLCSGQSNMEMPLTGWPPGDTILNSAQEIRNANLPNIRLCTVRRAFSPVPEYLCNASWEECSPATVPSFSATAFFFGRKLHEVLGVPIGLINASWGGTPVESWISPQSLSTLSEFSTTLRALPECAEGRRRILQWLHAHPSIDLQGRSGRTKWQDIDCDDGSCPDRSFADSSWRSMILPTLWERTGLGNFDGVVWFRKTVDIPSGWVGKDLVLELGPIDDMDMTFVNGIRVGGFEEEGYWNAKRTYSVPGSLIDSTTLLIAVRVIDNQGGGGIYGDSASMVLRTAQSGEVVSISGEWRYAPVAEFAEGSLFVFGPLGNRYEARPRMPVDLSADTPTTLFNGMIAPAVPFGIRGAIWYQGESNTDRPRQYHTLFPLLIDSWRNAFGGGDFPFYFVQIAPYDYGTVTQSQYLREAQTAALSVKNTGMVVTLDIGNAVNIHPANKQEVGQRLARWALAGTYGYRTPCSGPVYKSCKVRKGSIDLFFDHVEKGLEVRETRKGNSFQIAGPDSVFRDAVVTVRGKTLRVSHPEIRTPVAVRYAFSNTPEATLFNSAGLPAPSFRTDDWE